VGWKLKEYLTLRYTDQEAATLTHNALAALSYTLLFLACGFITLTGFAMKGMINPGGWLDIFFGWMIPLLGGEAQVRMLHRLTMWVILAFMIHHIAFVFYFEVFAERGLLSSMITGYKTKPSDWKPQDKPWEKN
jgi:Ni/Fe-hydrogenase 1 B-type cytochrome subunit